jgi:hypothetical protein
MTEKESQRERERERESLREFLKERNGVVGDNLGDCVFLGAEAYVQARSEDSAQGRKP